MGITRDEEVLLFGSRRAAKAMPGTELDTRIPETDQSFAGEDGEVVEIVQKGPERETRGGRNS